MNSIALTISSRCQHLITLLSDGEWHSGQQLADKLSVSRTAIWKQLSKLDEFGLTLDKVKGKGYRLNRAVCLLDAAQIHQQYAKKAQQMLLPPDVYFCLDSTNVLAGQHLKSGYVCIAEYQYAGKGRRGRQWVSPFASQVSMSVVIEFDCGVADITGLSLVVGLCVVEVLEQQGLKEVGLKWPNDIVYNNKKLGGILLEIRGDMSGPCQVIVGLGLNVSLGLAENNQAVDQIDQPYVDLKHIGEIQALDSISQEAMLNRNILSAALLNKMAELLVDFDQLGFEFYREEWLKRDVFFNQAVYVIFDGQKITGKEKGVDAQGQLLIETKEGLKTYNGGDVSLRLL